jgi:hypothetical protein
MVVLFGSTDAFAIEFTFTTVGLGDSNYRYEYLVRNDGSLGSGASIQLVDLLFDPALYDEGSLRNVSAPSLAASWSQTFLGSGPGVPAAFDMFATGPGIGVGEQLFGFAVDFHWLGSGTPGSQPFEIYDPNTFSLMQQGATTPVPEPETWGMMMAGALMLLTCRRRKELCAAQRSAS